MSESEKKSLILKRTTSLFKQAEELSVLCAIQIAIIIFSPWETSPIYWPSEAQATEIFKNYLKKPEVVRMKKLIKLETYLSEKEKAKEEDIRKMEQKNDEMEMEFLFCELIKGKSMNELDVRQTKGLLKLAALKKAKLEEMKKQLAEQNDQPKQGNDNAAGAW